MIKTFFSSFFTVIQKQVIPMKQSMIFLRCTACLLCMILILSTSSCFFIPRQGLSHSDTDRTPDTAASNAIQSAKSEETSIASDLVSESVGVTDEVTESPPLPEETTETAAETAEAVPADPSLYFENSLFVGDSILEGLAQYVRAQRQNGAEMLSDAKFLTSIMGIRVADLIGETAEHERIRYQYRGAVHEFSEIISIAKPKRLFLLVGMNDLAGGATVNDTVMRYERLLLHLKTNFPTLEIVVMTPTPKTSSSWLPDYCKNPEFGSPLLRSFADRLLSLCKSLSVPCVDIFTALADESGNLPDHFSRDNYVHINDLGSAVVVDTLNRFAKECTVS